MSKSGGFKFGPGFLVAAAFVGPGTITTASRAGASFGFALVWALVFSVIATLVLQEMAARLGLTTRKGLAEAMRDSFRSPVLGNGSVLLVVAAIGLGNAAYEAGNIAGGALALNIVSGISASTWAVVLGIAAAGLLASGRYGLVEAVLIGLVGVMSAVFILTAALVPPSFTQLFDGLFSLEVPSGSLATIMALIGTTVVPYNLFLHANAVREKWSADIPYATAIRESRRDTVFSIGLGGLITLAILSTAAAAFFRTGLEFSGASLAVQLEPLLGPWAQYVFAAGLFAAGLTSAITAPLAASYAVTGALGWDSSLKAPGFRLVWLAVLAIGTVFAAIGSSPLSAILFAQVANGFLLPVVAIFLLIVMNRRDLLGDQINTRLNNVLGIAVVAVAVLLGAAKLYSVVQAL